LGQDARIGTARLVIRSKKAKAKAQSRQCNLMSLLGLQPPKQFSRKGIKIRHVHPQR
jgi:hypothetical protein